jgi:hypothetical protein
MDEFSSCHPLGAASPVFAALGLDDLGLVWAADTDAVLTGASTAKAIAKRDRARKATNHPQPNPEQT